MSLLWIELNDLEKSTCSPSIIQRIVGICEVVGWFLWNLLQFFLRIFSISGQIQLRSRVLSIFTNPSARTGYDTRSIFKWSLTSVNSEFSFSKTSCLTKAEEPSLPYYLPIAGRSIIEFIPFLRVLVLCEMKSTSSRIWTSVTVSISYNDNHYTTGTSLPTEIGGEHHKP